MQFDDSYRIENMKYVIYSVRDMDIQDWKMWFTVPVAFVEFRPLVGVLVKSVW